MNNIINISERLKCAASLVNKGARVADIGTDQCISSNISCPEWNK